MAQNPDRTHGKLELFYFVHTLLAGDLQVKTFHDLVHAAKDRIDEIPVTKAEEAIQAADILIDVREESEFSAGHIPGAVHISRGMLEFKMDNNPALAARDIRIVVYCKTSGRAALSCVALQELGYKNVCSIAGGIEAWTTAGKPLVKPTPMSFE